MAFRIEYSERTNKWKVLGDKKAFLRWAFEVLLECLPEEAE